MKKITQPQAKAVTTASRAATVRMFLLAAMLLLSMQGIANTTPNPITGPAIVCQGSTITLSETSLSGAWNTPNTTIATVDVNGNVTGISTGIAVISYTRATLAATFTVTVNALPVVALTGGPLAGSLLTITSSLNYDSVVWDNGTTFLRKTLPSSITSIGPAGNISPMGLFVTSGGDLYAADFANNTVWKYAAGYTSSTTGVSVASGTRPRGVFVNGSNNIYYTDNNGRIDESGVGVVAQSGLDDPYGLWVDATGNVFDGENVLGLKEFPAGSNSTTVGTTIASGSFSGVCVGSDGAIYAVGNGDNVKKYIPLGGFGSYDAGTIVAGGQGLGAANNQLNGARGVFVDNTGNIYVADMNNNRVQKFPSTSTSGTNGVTVAGQGGLGSGATQLSGPTGVFVDASGAIYVADLGNKRIQIYKTVPSTLADTLTALSPGSYSAVVSSGGCSVTSNTVIITSAAPASITGTYSVCPVATTTLSDITVGGTWSTPNTTIAAVDVNGIVTGISTGTAVISYSTTGGSATATVTVYAAPSVTLISNSGPACTGASLRLSGAASGGTSPLSYSWAGPNLYIGTGAIPTVSVSLAAAGTYTLIVTDANGCAAPGANTTTAAVSVCNVAPVFVSVSPQTFSMCENGAAYNINSLLHVNDADASQTETWTQAAGGAPAHGSLSFTTATASSGSTDITPGGSITYTPTNGYTGNDGFIIKVSDGAASATITVSVTVNALPNAGAISGGSVVCAASTLPLTNTTADPPLAIGQNYGGGILAYILQPSDPGYDATLTQGLIAASSDQSAGTGWGCGPFFNASGSVIGTGAANTALIVTTCGTGTAAYLCTSLRDGGYADWYLPSLDELFAVYTGIGTTGGFTQTGYWVSTECGDNCAWHVDFTGGGENTNRKNTSLRVRAVRSFSIPATWTTSNTSVATVSTTGLVSAVASGTVMITYTAVNVNNCTATTTQAINVLPLPDIITGWSAPTASNVCAGNPLTVTINSTGLVAGTTYRVRYDINGANTAHGITTDMTFGPVGTGTFNTLTLSSAGTTTITVTAIQNEATNCASIPTTNNAVAITVNPNPIVNAGTALSAICRGGTTAALGGSVSGGTTGGIWTSSDPAGTFNNNDGTTPGTATYIASLSSAASVTLTLTTTGGSCGSLSASKSLTVNALPVIGSINSTGTICAGAALSLSSSATGTPTLVYSWAGPSFSAPGQNPTVAAHATTAATGIYTLTVTDGHTCVSTATTSATVNALPVINTIGNSGPICSGNSLSLNSSSTGAGELLYSWAGPSFTSTEDPNPLVSATATTAATGIYTLTVTDDNTCVNTATTSATVYALPVINTISSGPVCTNTPLNLSSSATGSPSLVYSWTGPNTFSTTGQNVNVTSSATPTVDGIYTLIVTDGHNCVTSSTTDAVINPLPNIDAINNNTPICEGAVLNLTSSASGGTSTLTYHWSGPSGYNVFGQNPSISNVPITANGTYVLTVTDVNNCVATGSNTTVANIIPVAAITGITEIQDLSLTTLSDATPGGVWSSPQSVISIAPGSGGTEVVTGLSAGVDVVSYTHLGCSRIAIIDVYPTALCVGTHLQLSDNVTGGTWSSGNLSFATVNPTTGLATGVSPGTVQIYHNATGGYQRIYSLSVGGLAPSAGTSSVCQGLTLSLTNSVTPGTWSISNTSLATVSNGVVSGISPGVVDVIYLAANGCLSVKQVTVNPRSAITGPSNVCTGQATQLNNVNAGGTWSSSNISMATVGLTTGIITGNSVATVNIWYTLPTGCMSTATITINPLSATNSVTSLCQSQSTTLTNTTSGGGTWSSSNASIATVGSTTGVTTGTGGGTVVISFTTPLGCIATKTITVNAVAPITGAASVCAGQTIQLSETLTGGSWSSSNNGLASVSNTGVVTGLSASTVNIIYTPASGCAANKTITVNPLVASGGLTSVCQSQAITLTNTTSGGGTWSTANTLTATVGSTTGVTNGISGGTAVISFTTPLGCITTKTITVSAGAPITGANAVCAGQATQLSDAFAGGTWTSSNVTMATVTSTGIVTGASAGIINITYAQAGGCAMTKSVTVNPLLAINGASGICQSPITLTNTTPGGGTWSTANTLIAIVGNTTGVTTGVSTGTAVISFTTPLGCVATKTVSVTSGSSAITGITSVCLGQTTQLSVATTGGTWSSSNISLATVTSTGVVSGASQSTVNILYTLPGGCVATATVTVNPLTASGGLTSVCQSQSITLTNTTSGGGTWSTANTLIATVGSTTGVTTGVGGGTAVISFTTPLGCVATKTVTVGGVSSITGITSVCVGQTTQLSDAVAGGTWLSYNMSMATVTNTGLVTGVSPTTISVVYTLPGGCTATAAITINPLVASGGFSTVCQSQAITLTNTTSGGGTWSTANTLTATVGTTTGVTNGVTAGVAVISFTTTKGCVATKTVTVNPLAPITGVTDICRHQTLQLSDAVTGGTWSSTNIWMATVTATTGIVTGVSAATISILYTLPTGCVTSSPFTVDPCGKAPDTTQTTSITEATGISDVRLFPNPNKGAFNIKGTLATLDDAEVSIDITDMLGQIVYRKTVTAQAGNINEQVQLNNSIANAMYIVIVRSGSETKMFHIVVEK